ncbi:carbohydrate kinase family protein [Aurantimicrobium minutum]|uniref:carbohydrate kinase family protein n=1 Tax=Aurantimicrobium minutum TaxID=708131 RepID=UPI002473FC4E|nr:carbohydrate kinase [Aurantimicrobium minutum]MDH6207151.1 fructokinase [Aurantimicrobium minutum]
MSDRIVVIGEALIDLIQQADGCYQAKPGGAPANVSIALARLGAHVSFAGRMSNDKFGQKLHDWLSPEKIDLSLVERTSDPTSLAVASLDDQGKASYSFYLKGTADWGWTLGAFVHLEVEPPAALVIGSVATAIEPGASVIENLAGHLHSTENSTVIIDLNIRPGLGFERENETVRVERQIKLAHIVKASDDDLAWLYPDRSPVDTARLWAGAGHHVIMTRGADGATLFTPTGDTVSVKAPVIELVDTVGAGDSFLGATLYGLQQRGALGGNAEELLSKVTLDEWIDLLTLAAEVGAITCSRAGCNPPTLAELGL